MARFLQGKSNGKDNVNGKDLQHIISPTALRPSEDGERLALSGSYFA
ncbi:MAG: hypothetical protein J6M54_01405 [Prevotella sp.]|nr:hypothetical protein [Prevotella sp.]